MAGQVPETGGLGRGQHHRDTDLLPAAAGTPQASEEHQYAQAAQLGDQAPDAGRVDLSEHLILPSTDPGLVRRDARNLARGQPLSEHDVPCGTKEGAAKAGRLKQPRRRCRSGLRPPRHRRRTRINQRLDYLFAQLDAHN